MAALFSDNEPPLSEDGSAGSTPVPSHAPTTDEYVQMLQVRAHDPRLARAHTHTTHCTHTRTTHMQYAMMTPRGRGLHPSHNPKTLVDVVVDFSSEDGGERSALD